MNVLALEPYYGGSHRAFLDQWVERSRLNWTLLTLPAYKWKWRMRHAAVTFGERVNAEVGQGGRWDMVFCSDMLNLAEFQGLTAGFLGRMPSVIYFHENQLTYPVRVESERDYQYVMTNLISALAATQVWFNSAFHQDSFLEALGKFLQRMPDYRPLDAVATIREKSSIKPPGIRKMPSRDARQPGPMRLLWSARWEHDKNPEEFFSALDILNQNGIEFRLDVVGEQFRDTPKVFDYAREKFADQIDRWGYRETREDYEQTLLDADVVVSTANHEFFGISMVEAIAAGAFPLLPDRLAYPEILDKASDHEVDRFLYDGTVKDLARKLVILNKRINENNLWKGDPDQGIRKMERFYWDQLVDSYDDALQGVCFSSDAKRSQ